MTPATRALLLDYLIAPWGLGLLAALLASPFPLPLGPWLTLGYVVAGWLLLMWDRQRRAIAKLSSAAATPRQVLLFFALVALWPLVVTVRRNPPPEEPPV